MVDTEKLHKTLSEFLENKFWAKYYGEAPSVAKEFIALEMYASDNDVDDDEEFDKLQKEIEEGMEDEDKKYLAEHSPSPQERIRFARMIAAPDSKGEEKDGDSPDDLEVEGDNLKIQSEEDK